ncbi:MAG: hypothetical protein H9W82_12465 [Lactobacillus sp.]|nr:hypothetical protein [Lactobacillus sp.]
MAELKFNIVEHIATISEGNGGEYTLELNKISWNDKEPKMDLRRWKNTDNGLKIAQKGLTLNNFELEALRAVL